MQRIDDPTADDTDPAKLKFTEGNPATGVPATILRAAWANSIQEELSYVIETLGIALNPADNTQLYTALEAWISSSLSGRVANAFQASPKSPASMKVGVSAGYVFVDGTLTEVAQQDTATITAPVSNSRIDRIVVTRATGVVSVVTGTASASPSAPAIPTGKNPIAQVLLTSASTSITAGMIKDERAIDSMGLGLAAFKNLGADIVDNGSGDLTSKRVISFKTGDYTLVGSDRNKEIAFAITGTTTLTSPSGATLGAGYSVDVINRVTSTANLTISSVSNLYGGVTIATSMSLAPGESGRITSDGSALLVTNLVRIIPAATTSLAGKVQLATTAEVDTGTDTAKAVTPAALAGSKLTIKASWDMTSAGALTSGFNVTSTVRNSMGNYTVNLSITAPASYAMGLESTQLIIQRVTKGTTSINYKTGFGGTYNAADADSSGMIIY